MMYTPQIATSQEFPQDNLVKHFDAEGRIVRIDFVISGKYVLIEYLPEGTDGHSRPRKVWWSDGHVYLSWKEDDRFRHEHIVRPFTCEMPRSVCCGECDNCSYRGHRVFFKSYEIFR